MSKRKNLTGQQFGNLLVLEYAYSDQRGRTYWRCKCICDEVSCVRIDNLNSGHTSSCGKPDCCSPKQLQKNKVFVDYKRRAKTKQISFTFSYEEFDKLTSLPCAYCGESDLNYRGVDRINSNLGYDPTNCVPCCEKCNRSKFTLSKEEFFKHIDKIYNYSIAV